MPAVTAGTVAEGDIGVGDEQQDGVRQHECEGDERNLNVVLQQGVDSERCGDCLEPRDQRELQREDRQSHEAERNREFNEERTAWWHALADRQQERRQAEQQVEEHPDKATQGVPHCVITPTTRSGPAPDLLTLPRRSAHIRPTPRPALVTEIAQLPRTRRSHQRESYVPS